MAEVNCEHIRAIKARIQEIRRRFVDARACSEVSRPKSASIFSGILRGTRTSQLLPCPGELEPLIARAAQKYGVSPAVIRAVVRVESGFRPGAVSRVGAVGLMQLMPGTARALGVDPADPEQNIDGGTRYLRQQIDRFGSLELALAAYNAGPASVVRYGGVPPFAETQRYVREILRNVEVYSKEG